MFINVRHACLQCTLLRSNLYRKIATTTLKCEKRKSFYDILGVAKDCTQKEIKAAYISLSKVHHPDRNKNATEDKEFKKIVEAYQVLSRPHSRTNYDNHLRGIDTVTNVSEDIVHSPYEPAPEQRYSPINEYDYYGIKGVRKVSNMKIVLACVIFCLIGVTIQVIAISHSVTFKREVLTLKTAQYNKNHIETRKEAKANTNDDNLIRVLNRMKQDEE